MNVVKPSTLQTPESGRPEVNLIDTELKGRLPEVKTKQPSLSLQPLTDSSTQGNEANNNSWLSDKGVVPCKAGNM